MIEEPFVSVVIPTHNNESTIRECLNSLINQSYPKDKYEIILVDDSTDSTTEIAKAYPVKILLRNGLPGAKRNFGIEQTKGEIIGFIDSDAIAEKDWIAKGVSHFISNKIAVIGGPNLTPKDSPFISSCVGEVFSSQLGTSAMSARYTKDGFIARDATETDLISCNMFIRKKIVKEIGGFDETIFPCEENDLMFRVKQAGYKLLYVPDLVVYHRHKSSIKAFFKQLLRYGASRGRLVKKHPGVLKPVHVLPSIFVIGLLAGSVLSYIIRSFLYIYLAVLLGYLITILFVSLKKAVYKRDYRLIYTLPLLFFVLHFSYGLGFLRGLLK